MGQLPEETQDEVFKFLYKEFLNTFFLFFRVPRVRAIVDHCYIVAVIRCRLLRNATR